MSTIIGIVGEKGAGKDTFVKLLSQILDNESTPDLTIGVSTLNRTFFVVGKPTTSQSLFYRDKKIAHVRFSDHLRETLNLWHLPQTRENLQKLAVVMNDGFGETAVSDAVFHRIKDLNADIICIDGVRWESDVSLTRKFPTNILIYVTASPGVRFERLLKRGEKVGESQMDFEQFSKEEQAKNELLIPKIGTLADVKINNEGNFEQFEAQIKEKVIPLIR